MSGILDNGITELDIVYTKLGRFYRSIGSEDAIITKYAFSDDGIDYNLFNEEQEEDSINRIIETPMISSWTDENNSFRNKLMTLPLNTDEIVGFDVNPTNIIYELSGRRNERIVSTVNIFSNFNTRDGYYITLQDSRFLFIDIPLIDSNVSRTITPNSASTNASETTIQSKFNSSNRNTQRRFLSGINVTPSNVSFDLLYDANNAVYAGSEDFETVVSVESVNLGFKKDINVKILSGR